jgi:hypothetical protein
MKSRLLSILCLALLCAPCAHAQDATTKDVYTKIAKIDMLFDVLPLLLTKDQLNQLLPVIEKCRSRIKKSLVEEDKIFLEVESLASDTYDKSVATGNMPSDAARSKLAQTIKMADINRTQTVAENVSEAFAAFDKILNPAQKKIAANSIDIGYYDPTAKVKDMSQELKEQAYVRYILLNPVSYDVMLDLLNAAKG